MIRRIGSIVVCLTFFIPFVGVDSAEAGVLLRSSKVRSQVRTRVPRLRLGFRPASTVQSISRNPINSQTLTSANALESYSRRRARYVRELKRYEKRKQRENKRLAKRRARDKERKLRAQQRVFARRAAQNKRSAELNKKLGTTDAEVTSVRGGDSSVVRIEGRKSKPSFWSRFWQKLIGNNK